MSDNETRTVLFGFSVQPSTTLDLMCSEREFWMQQRRAMLMSIDAIERRFDIQPTTADIRRRERRQE